MKLRIIALATFLSSIALAVAPPSSPSRQLTSEDVFSHAAALALKSQPVKDSRAVLDEIFSELKNEEKLRIAVHEEQRADLDKERLEPRADFKALYRLLRALDDRTAAIYYDALERTKLKLKQNKSGAYRIEMSGKDYGIFSYHGKLFVEPLDKNLKDIASPLDIDVASHWKANVRLPNGKRSTEVRSLKLDISLVRLWGTPAALEYQGWFHAGNNNRALGTQLLYELKKHFGAKFEVKNDSVPIRSFRRR